MASDKSAAIIVFPQLVVRKNRIDYIQTAVQITNTSSHQIAARCFLVNANSHCSNAGVEGGGYTVPLVCEDNHFCNGPPKVTGGFCIPGWSETDFRIRLTAHQPIKWNLDEGLSNFPLDGVQHIGPVDPDTGLHATNVGSSIPPVPEVPFRGELKCIQVDRASEQPAQGTDAANNFVGDLIGEATILSDPRTFHGEDRRDAHAQVYNAVGILAVQDATLATTPWSWGASTLDARAC